MVDCSGVEECSLVRSHSDEISPRTVPPECADPKSPSPPPSPFDSDASAGGNVSTAPDILALAKRPENEPSKPVYKRRVAASTSRDNKEDPGDDK